MECRKRLAKAHLGVPKHFIAFLELLQCFLNGIRLFRTEDNWRKLICVLIRGIKALAPLFDSGNGMNGGGKGANKPLTRTAYAWKFFAFDATAQQHIMHLFVIKAGKAKLAVIVFASGDGYFGML
ncbi:MAG: hypothetical protein NC117_07665 [Pseudoflavonifractor sp.]|nr:hypothetical protein [Pseudoflavonifractor sp.]